MELARRTLVAILDCCGEIDEGVTFPRNFLIALFDKVTPTRRTVGLDMQAAVNQGSTPRTQSSGALTAEQGGVMELSGLPESVLLSVLDRLSPRELAGTCCLVSQSMKAAALSNDLWRNRFKNLPQEFRAFVESRRLYPWLWHALYHTNLLSNVNWGNISGHNNWLMNSSGWRVTLHGGHGWQAESPPAGMPPLDVKPLPRLGAAPINTAGALASSYAWCEVMQAVDVHMELQKRGMSHASAEAYLDRGPELTFAVWCGGRFDCGSTAQIMVVLDNGRDVLPPYTGRANFPWQRTALTHWESGPIDLEAQNNKWVLVTHTFKDYPRGVRRAIIVLRGKDHRVWAGWYGAKFAAPELHFGTSRWSDGVEPPKGST